MRRGAAPIKWSISQASRLSTPQRGIKPDPVHHPHLARQHAVHVLCAWHCAICATAADSDACLRCLRRPASTKADIPSSARPIMSTLGHIRTAWLPCVRLNSRECSGAGSPPLVLSPICHHRGDSDCFRRLSFCSLVSLSVVQLGVCDASGWVLWLGDASTASSRAIAYSSDVMHGALYVAVRYAAS